MSGTLDIEARVDQQLAVFARGAVELIEAGELRGLLSASLRDGRPLRI